MVVVWFPQHAKLFMVAGASPVSSSLSRKLGVRLTRKIVSLNGESGLLTFIDGVLFAATSLETDGQTILALYTVLNPQKLKSLPQLNSAALRSWEGDQRFAHSTHQPDN
jgi:hypothetical protein